MSKITEVQEFLSQVRTPEMMHVLAAQMHEANLVKARAEGFRYGPFPEVDCKIMPSILPYALLPHRSVSRGLGGLPQINFRD